MQRKHDEVTGKPTQYNLRTLEYDWKELPDTHFPVKPSVPRVRDTGNYVPPAGANRNGNRRRGDEGADMKSILGGGVELGNQRGGGPAPRSPQPAPAPSRPLQEDFAFDGGRGAGGVNRSEQDNDRNRAAGMENNERAPPSSAGYNNNPSLDPVLLRAVAGGQGGFAGDPYQQPPQLYAQPYLPQPPPQPPQPMYVAPWSHEDLRRQVMMNQAEAGRSYLHQYH